MKATSVTNDEGEYEFTNLKNGKYFLFTQFGYVHSFTKTEVVGQTDHYVNDTYQGSSAVTRSYGVGVSGDAVVEKVVTIDNDGDVQKADLKKTK